MLQMMRLAGVTCGLLGSLLTGSLPQTAQPLSLHAFNVMWLPTTAMQHLKMLLLTLALVLLKMQTHHSTEQHRRVLQDTQPQMLMCAQQQAQAPVARLQHSSGKPSGRGSAFRGA